MYGFKIAFKFYRILYNSCVTWANRKMAYWRCSKVHTANILYENWSDIDKNKFPPQSSFRLYRKTYLLSEIFICVYYTLRLLYELYVCYFRCIFVKYTKRKTIVLNIFMLHNLCLTDQLHLNSTFIHHNKMTNQLILFIASNKTRSTYCDLLQTMISTVL